MKTETEITQSTSLNPPGHPGMPSHCGNGAGRTEPCLVYHFARHHQRSLFPELSAPALIHWSGNDWRASHDVRTADSGVGLHYADLDTSHLPPGGKALFTFYWTEIDKWEENTFEVTVK